MAAPTNKPLAVVNLGYRVSLLLPADKAMKLVELLTHAAIVEADYTSRLRRDQYTLGDPLEVNLSLVQPSQIHPAKAQEPIRRDEVFRLEGPKL